MFRIIENQAIPDLYDILSNSDTLLTIHPLLNIKFLTISTSLIDFLKWFSLKILILLICKNCKQCVNTIGQT